MERYYVYTMEDEDGGTRVGTLKEAIALAKRRGGFIRNMQEKPSEGGSRRYYNPGKVWSATGRPWEQDENA